LIDGKRRIEHRAEGIGENEEKRIAQSAKRIAERYKEEYELQEEGEKSIANWKLQNAKYTFSGKNY
jgi:hypothetical protein